MHTPSAITIRVDGAGVMPADDNDSGSHDRSAFESGRNPPSPSSKTSTASVPCRHVTATPVADLVTQVARPRQLDQAALPHAAPQREQRRVRARPSGEQQGDPAPGFRRVHQPGRVGGRSLAPAARLAVAQHFHLPAGDGHLGQRADGVNGVQEGRFAARQLGRQAKFGLAAVAQAGRDQQALRQQPRGAVEHGGRSEGLRVGARCVDHQHRGSMAAQEPAPGEVDRLGRAGTLGKARLLHALQPLQRRQGLGGGEARHRGGEGRRRRRGT